MGRDLILGDVWRFIFPGAKSTYFHGDVVSWIVGMVVEYFWIFGSGFPGGDCSFIPVGDVVGRCDVVDVLPGASVGGQDLGDARAWSYICDDAEVQRSVVPVQFGDMVTWGECSDLHVTASRLEKNSQDVPPPGWRMCTILSKSAGPSTSSTV